jgi:hypothetical protein
MLSTGPVHTPVQVHRGRSTSEDATSRWSRSSRRHSPSAARSAESLGVASNGSTVVPTIQMSRGVLLPCTHRRIPASRRRSASGTAAGRHRMQGSNRPGPPRDSGCIRCNEAPPNRILCTDSAICAPRPVSGDARGRPGRRGAGRRGAGQCSAGLRRTLGGRGPRARSMGNRYRMRPSWSDPQTTPYDTLGREPRSFVGSSFRMERRARSPPARGADPCLPPR